MRFRSIIGAFLFFVLATSIAFIVFIQTKSFGGLVTRIVSDLSERQLNTKVKIKSFSISVFPPGIELNKVAIQKEISSVEKFEAELGRIGLYVSLIEIEERKLTLGEIRVSDSYIKYVSPEKDEELKEIDQAIIDKVFKISEDAPIGVDTIVIENSKIALNHELLEARRLKLFKQDDSFIARFHLANIRPSSKSDMSFDEVWGDMEITRKDMTIFRLKAQHDIQTLLLKGKVTDYPKLKSATASIKGEAQLHLKNLNHSIELPEIVKIINGHGKLTFDLSYKEKNLLATSDFFIEDFKSNFLFAEEASGVLKFHDNKLWVNKLDVKYKKQKAHLLKPALIYNFDNSQVLPESIFAHADNFSLNNALRILPKLKIIKGRLTGDLKFDYKGKDLYFYPQDNFVVNKLGLVTGNEKPFEILMISKAVFKKSKFYYANDEFHLSANVDLPKSSLAVDGFVTKDKVSFKVNDAKVDLEDFGNISQLDVKGAGTLSVVVEGPLDQTEINLKGKTKGFEILGYKLDETEKDITIDLGQSTVLINKMESRYGKTHLTGNGSVDYSDRDIALGISSKDALAADMVHILNPIFKDLTFLPNDLDFRAQVDVDIFGKYKLEDLKIRSKVNFNDLVAYGESLTSGSFDIGMSNKVLNFKNFNADKGQGSISGDLSIDLKDKSLDLNYVWENLELNSFNFSKRFALNLNSGVSGKISGGGKLDDYLLKLETLAFNTKSSIYNFPDSTIHLDIRPKRIAGKANLLGSIIDTKFNLSLRPGLASDLSLKFKATNIKPFLVAVFGQHLETEEFSGRAEFEGVTTFQDGFNHLYLNGALKELHFNHDDFKVNFSATKPQFVVHDSVLQTWNLNINQPDIFISTKGDGVFGKKVSLTHEFNLNSKILEILISPILSSEGFLKNIVHIDGRGPEMDFRFSSKVENLNMTVERLPVNISDLNYDIVYANKRLTLNNISSSLENGSASIKGDIYFDSDQPDVNLKYVLQNAEIPVLGKSSINLTGDGIILGNSAPYSVGGEIVVNKAQIVNELNEFSSKSSGFSQVRFLPKNQESILGRLFNININVKVENPARITNSLMDVALKGEVRLLGNPSQPRGEGRLFAPANSSRIFFKNNEYQILNADINFNPKKPLAYADFDIQAVTFISMYKVYPKVYGDLERFSFDLTSEPGLSRNSILSLIAFGYTEDLQSTLRPEDQQSLNQAAAGSFIFDRFKISDILNKQFGLQINLGTVIEQSSTDSLLSGRSQGTTDSSGALGRTKSATRIELKKRLDEALTLSVSSTMGGSIGQRQSINLNYGLSRSIQAEGVFEQRTGEEGQVDINYNSIGGDLKFRRTFK